MSAETPEILLAHYLKALKLPTFQREYQKLARLCATEGVDHVGYLTRLAEREMIERDRRKVERRIKAARSPVVKSLDSFDFAAIPKLNKMRVLELARCEWIDRRENVIALGPSGTGKTHVALGLGLAACQRGLSVGFTTAATLITSNLPFDEWTETLGSERLTGALLDRITHHVNILEMNGDSYRLAQSRARKAGGHLSKNRRPRLRSPLGLRPPGGLRRPP
ncbi:ATP-binding protein [Agrobacterium rhizogenes]|uniref:ATP-binding protein n=1 Tax=Rhizobium rhizogenes TaxID=359 RepID=UPI0022B750B0|nr:ATP-binding protein [Rhizobium rhizogenes]MCZ7450792.1 ATP-binding protein [Rhizobium rhizogenes]